MARKVTNKLYELIDEGVLTHELVMDSCLRYMSEAEVEDMAESNELIETDD